MRVAHLVQKPQRRGAEVFGHQLCTELRRRGYEVLTVYLYSYDGPAALPLDPADLVLRGDEANALDRIVGFEPQLARRVVAALEAFSPDIVQANGARTVKYGALARRMARQDWPLVYRNIGEPLEWVRGWRRKAFYRHFVMSQVDAIVAVSDVTLERLQSFYALRKPAIRLPRAVDPMAFLPQRSRHESRAALRTPAAAPVVLFVGSLTAEKRLDRLIRVFERIRQEEPDAHLWIVGDGPERPTVEALVRASPAGRSVHLVGVRDDVADLMAASDVFLLVSDTEGIPGVLLEAGLVSLPVVATAVGGVPEVIIDGRTGLLGDRDDGAALASAVVTILRDHDAAERIGGALRRHVTSLFSLSSVADRYVDFYRHLVNEVPAADAGRGT